MNKGLSLQGGGIMGAAQAGMLHSLSQKDPAYAKPSDVWKQVAGTSIGSLNGLMVALGMTAKEIYDVWTKIKKSDFVSINWFGLRKHLYNRKRMRAWVENLVKSKVGRSDIDFSDLKKIVGVNLMCVGTVVQTGEPIVFGLEYENVPVVDAIMMSTAYPVGFEPVEHVDKHSGKKYQIIDGGIMMNSPVLPLMVEECNDITILSIGSVDDTFWIDGSIEALQRVLEFVTLGNENMSIVWAKMSCEKLTIYHAPCKGCDTFSWDKIQYCLLDGVSAVDAGPIDALKIAQEHGFDSKFKKLL